MNENEAVTAPSNSTTTPVPTGAEISGDTEMPKKTRKSRRASAFLLLSGEQVDLYPKVKDLDEARDVASRGADGVYYRVCIREQIVKSTPKPVEPKATVVVRKAR